MAEQVFAIPEYFPGCEFGRTGRRIGGGVEDELLFCGLWDWELCLRCGQVGAWEDEDQTGRGARKDGVVERVGVSRDISQTPLRFFCRVR